MIAIPGQMSPSFLQILEVWPELKTPEFTEDLYHKVLRRTEFLVLDVDAPGGIAKVHSNIPSLSDAVKFVSVRNRGLIFYRENIRDRTQPEIPRGQFFDFFAEHFGFIHPKIVRELMTLVSPETVSDSREKCLATLATVFARDGINGYGTRILQLTRLLGEILYLEKLHEDEFTFIKKPDFIEIEGVEYRFPEDFAHLDVYHPVYSVLKMITKPDAREIGNIMLSLLQSRESAPMMRASLARFMRKPE